MKALLFSVMVTASIAVIVPVASARDMIGTRIASVVVSDTLVYIYPVVPIPGSAPTCVSDSTYYSFAQTRPAAKQFLAAALAAMAQNALVDLSGTNLCTDQGWSETLSYIKVSAP